MNILLGVDEKLGLQWFTVSWVRICERMVTLIQIWLSVFGRFFQIADGDEHGAVDVEVGAIPLAGVARIYAMRDGVRGFVPHPSRLNQDWSAVWLAR